MLFVQMALSRQEKERRVALLKEKVDSAMLVAGIHFDGLTVSF